MDVTFHILFLLKRLVILLAILTRSQEKTCYKTQAYFRKVLKHGGQYTFCNFYFLYILTAGFFNMQFYMKYAVLSQFVQLLKNLCS